MMEALAKFFGWTCPGGLGKNKAGKKSKQKIARFPMTPEEAYKRRVAKRKRKAQKDARRRNRR